MEDLGKQLAAALGIASPSPASEPLGSQSNNPTTGGPWAEYMRQSCSDPVSQDGFGLATLFSKPPCLGPISATSRGCPSFLGVSGTPGLRQHATDKFVFGLQHKSETAMHLMVRAEGLGSHQASIDAGRGYAAERLGGLPSPATPGSWQLNRRPDNDRMRLLADEGERKTRTARKSRPPQSHPHPQSGGRGVGVAKG